VSGTYLADLSTTSGWTERWATGNGATTSDGTNFSIAMTTEDWYGFSINAVDADADRQDCEILAKFRYTNPGSDTRGGGIFARGSGTTSESGILFGFGVVGSPFIVELSAGSEVQSSSGSRGELTEDTWYWMRAKLSSTTAKVRVWADGDVEYGFWEAELTGLSVTADGWIGMWGSDIDYDPIEFAYFEVATGTNTLNGPADVTLTTTAYASPGTTSSVDRGASMAAWSNTGNIVSSNNSYATSTAGTSGCDYLVASNFGFSIPDNAIVVDLTCSVEGKATTSVAELFAAGEIDVNDGITQDYWISMLDPHTLPTTEGVSEKSGSLYPGELSGSVVNSSAFGVSFYADGTDSGKTLSVDHVQLKVTYFVPPSGSGMFWATNC
jgi:hypothetical protein